MKYFWIGITLFLASCASVPVAITIPEGKVQVSEKELTQVLENYKQLVGEHQELRECQEWRDKMFF
jgi:starvation-inducible outer membrane lipoprotein